MLGCYWVICLQVHCVWYTMMNFVMMHACCMCCNSANRNQHQATQHTCRCHWLCCSFFCVKHRVYLCCTYTDDDTVSLFQFMETVATEIPSKWKRLGVAFGLNQSQIDAIEKRRLADPIECFSDVFHHWQQTSTPQKPANWSSLVRVLCSRYVGEERLAEYVQNTFLWHLSIVQYYPRNF